MATNKSLKSLEEHLSNHIKSAIEAHIKELTEDMIEKAKVTFNDQIARIVSEVAVNTMHTVNFDSMGDCLSIRVKLEK